MLPRAVRGCFHGRNITNQSYPVAIYIFFFNLGAKIGYQGGLKAPRATHPKTPQNAIFFTQKQVLSDWVRVCRSCRVHACVYDTQSPSPFWALFLDGPEKFSHPKSCSKISNVMSTELFYTHIPNINWGSLHTRTFRRKQLFVCEYRSAKNGFGAPKIFQGLREMGPWYSKDRVGFVETTTVFQFPQVVHVSIIRVTGLAITTPFTDF